MSEFEIIRAYFSQQGLSRSEVILGIGDDAAITKISAGYEQVITTDTLVSGAHFPAYTSPFDIGYKALAVNLSDLAAMGAEPVWFTLNLCLPAFDQDWLREFSAGLFSLASEHNICLVGGDTVKGPLSISIQATGQLPAGSALKRSGAQPGDKIFVSGFIGDAALAFTGMNGELDIAEEDLLIVSSALNNPVPRVALGQRLQGIASSVIDISDGLSADLGHILVASHCGATIDLQQLPFSKTYLKYFDQLGGHGQALGFGDDYELCFTAPEKFIPEINKISEELGCKISQVGEVNDTLNLIFQNESGQAISISEKGYDHFSDA